MQKGGVDENGGAMQKGGVDEKGGAIQKCGVDENGGAMQKGGVDENGGAMQKGGVDENGGAMQKGGINEKDEAMRNGGVDEKGGAMQKGGADEKVGAMQKGGVDEKGRELEQKCTDKFPVSEQQAGNECESAAVHLCEVCGTCFETRRGLSSHARSHLRQLGVCMSESSGAPIRLLYELITERDGALPFTPKHTHTTSSKHTSHTQHRQKCTTHSQLRHKHTTHTQHRPKHTTKHGTKLKIKIGELVKRQCVPAPVSLGDSSSSSSSSPLHHHKPLKTPPTVHALSKILGGPQETDTSHDQNTVEMSGEGVHVCELCGAWYETNKGLASHARAHLRHFGVELDPKALPIKVLHDLLQMEAGPEDQDLPIALLTPPPLKRRKSSPAREKAQTDSDSSKNASCEFCGESFKTTQSLASHARSHLRQLGVTDWTAHGSPMVALRDLMAHRGCSSLPRATQTTPLTPAQVKFPAEAPPRAAVGTSSLLFPKPQSESWPTPVPGPASARVPKARKGSRLAKPKDEPVELEISTKTKTTLLSPPQFQLTTVQSAANHMTVVANRNLTTGPQVEVGVNEPVRCDYCGDLFDSRKALSCHARAHLRQLGVKWPPYASPIDTLNELMIREGRGQGSEDTPSPVDLCKEKPEMDGAGSVCDATCELCGFDFENRKALASHARAHLRQQGEQWSSSQSPITVLSQWMSREPEKVAALHQLYMQGTLPHIRKKRVCSPIRTTVADSARSSVSRFSSAARHGKPGASLSYSSSFHRKLSYHHTAPHSTVNHGSDHRTPKHFSLRMERVESLKRLGNAPSLVPRPPETSLVKLVGKIYSLKCRFCEQVFSGPLSVQEDWLIHLRHHILNLKPDNACKPAPILAHSESAQLIGQAV